MNIIASIIAGIAGTEVMILMIRIVPALFSRPRFDIAAFVGQVVNQDERSARGLGWLILSIIGSFFALLFIYIRESILPGESWLWGLILGAGLGTFINAMILGTLRLYPRFDNEALHSRWITSLSIWIGCLVYGLIVVLVYGVLS